MQQIIKGNQVVPDTWELLPKDASLDQLTNAGDIIVPLAMWLATLVSNRIRGAVTFRLIFFMPYVLAFNMDAAPAAEDRIAKALGAPDALAGLQQLRTQLDAPTNLADYGFRQDHIAEAVDLTLSAVPANNPRPVTVENLTELFDAALRGTDPAVLR